MAANYAGDKLNTGQRGFSFLELVVVIAIISVLIAVALDRYSHLLVDVERTSMEHDLGVMRSAVAMQVAAHFLAGDMPGLERLVNSNPMDLLAEQPNNYLGARAYTNWQETDTGSWYFDTENGSLIYLVINERYFETKLAKPARARFKIYPVYSDKKLGTKKVQYLSGLTLKPVESYRWLKPANE